MVTYSSVDPQRPRTMGEQLIRDLVEDRVLDLGKLMHYSDLVGAGEQWAIPIALDCGFSGSIVIQVDAIGDCERPAGELAGVEWEALMTLLLDICRGISETIRETLPSDDHELRVFTGAFCVTVLVQLVVFAIVTTLHP